MKLFYVYQFFKIKQWGTPAPSFVGRRTIWHDWLRDYVPSQRSAQSLLTQHFCTEEFSRQKYSYLAISVVNLALLVIRLEIT